MNFPLVGTMTDSANPTFGPENPAAEPAPMVPPPFPTGAQAVAPAAPPVQPAQPAREAAAPPVQAAVPVPASGARVIVYGRAGCRACAEAIQDLLDRQISFSYYDVDRDPVAMGHVQAICGVGAATLVPIIVQMGYGGAT